MKNGFTMIELIFVIVILGILASVAIPKLAEVRDESTMKTEAEIKAEHNNPQSVPNSKFPHTIYTAQ